VCGLACTSCWVAGQGIACSCHCSCHVYHCGSVSGAAKGQGRCDLGGWFFDAVRECVRVYGGCCVLSGFWESMIFVSGFGVLGHHSGDVIGAAIGRGVNCCGGLCTYAGHNHINIDCFDAC